MQRNPELARLVAEKLCMKWSPEQIAGRFALEKYPVRFSYATIYRTIDQHVLPYSLKKELRIKCKYRRHKADDRRGKGTVLPVLRSVPRRPMNGARADTLKVIPSWECVERGGSEPL